MVLDAIVVGNGHESSLEKSNYFLLVIDSFFKTMNIKVNEHTE